jgi:hypothetical protein
LLAELAQIAPKIGIPLRLQGRVRGAAAARGGGMAQFDVDGATVARLNAEAEVLCASDGARPAAPGARSSPRAGEGKEGKEGKNVRHESKERKTEGRGHREGRDAAASQYAIERAMWFALYEGARLSIQHGVSLHLVP